MSQRIYIASKTRHANKWLALRAGDVPIISAWIDEAGVAMTSSLADLWVRCINEAMGCDALIAYIEPGDMLKGGLVEIGAALGRGRPVFLVGDTTDSWKHHPLVQSCASVDEAVRLAMTRVRRWFIRDDGSETWLRGPYEHIETAGAVRREMEDRFPDKTWNLQIVQE